MACCSNNFIADVLYKRYWYIDTHCHYIYWHINIHTLAYNKCKQIWVVKTECTLQIFNQPLSLHFAMSYHKNWYHGECQPNGQRKATSSKSCPGTNIGGTSDIMVHCCSPLPRRKPKWNGNRFDHRAQNRLEKYLYSAVFTLILSFTEAQRKA